MARLVSVFSLIIFSASLSLAQKRVEAVEHLPFQQPAIVETGEVKYPANSVAYGIVALEVTIDTEGHVEAVNVDRDIVSLTPEAIRAVRGWKFKPAHVGGKPIRSKTAIAVVFDPAVNDPPPAPLGPLAEHPDEETQDLRFTLPQVIQAVYPRYPLASVAEGTVVLQLEIDAEGKAEAVKTLREIVSLTPEAVRAVKRWKFEPAKVDGKPVTSKMTVAFLFRRPRYRNTR
jgi:TonB family protein